MHGKMEEIAKSLEEITFLMDDYRVLNSSSERMSVLMEMLKETEKIFFAISSQLYKEIAIWIMFIWLILLWFMCVGGD